MERRGEAAAVRTVHEADLGEAKVGQLDVARRRDQQATRTQHTQHIHSTVECRM